jgi:hypothetical protein
MPTTARDALDVLSKAMKNDVDYAVAWYLNIRGFVAAEGVEDSVAENIAARIMFGCFNADVDKIQDRIGKT